MANEVVTINLDLTSLNDETDGMQLLAGQGATIGYTGWGTGGEVSPVFTPEGGTEIEATADAVTDASNAKPNFEAKSKGILKLRVTTAGSAGNTTGSITRTSLRQDVFFT